MSPSLRRLVILHTNDIHSHFENIPKIADWVRRHREWLGADELLVIDCGDHMDRAFVETEGTDGAANVAVMNKIGYDAAIMGNNEGLTFSLDKLQSLYGEQARFPVIGSNMRLTGNGELPSWLKPYLIVRKGDLTVGMIGVTVNYTDFYSLLGWDVRDPLETVAQLVRQLRDEVDILIVLSHLGLSADQRMASEIDGIDCIFGAHTHHLLEVPLQVGDTVICAAGKFGNYAGKLELTYDVEQKRVVSFAGGCEKMSELTDDPGIESVIDRYREIGRRNLDQVVTTIGERLAIEWNRESPLGNLLALGLRKWCDAEVGIVNSGQLLGALEAGNVSRGRLLEICPSPINPCRVVLYGSDLREALEQSLLPEYQDMAIYGYGFRGTTLGMLSVAGMQIEVDDSKPGMQKISRILINGKELEDDQEIVVGTIDMFTFGIGYLSLSRGRNVQYYVPEFLRDVLLHQLNDDEHMALCSRRNWLYRG